MPHYDYSCADCGFKEEIFQKISDSPLTECTRCGKFEFYRGPGGGIGLQFQGSGFYITDYNRSPSSTGSTSATDKPEKQPESSTSCGCGKQVCKKE